MKNKVERLRTIRELIKNQQMGSQEELLNVLQEKGFSLTQATLSRDLKQLKVAKIPTPEGHYYYALPDRTSVQTTSLNTEDWGKGVFSVEISGQMAVIKTRPGYASGIAYDIDNSGISQIMGTIAGDDTVLLILRQEAVADKILKSLERILKSK